MLCFEGFAHMLHCVQPDIKRKSPGPLCAETRGYYWGRFSLSLLMVALYTGIRKWTAGVERKENAPFGLGGEVEVKTCSWAFLCTGRPKKESREQKAVISHKYSAFRGSQFLWLPKRKRRGGYVSLVGFSSQNSQSPDRWETWVCVCMSASVGVSITPRSPVIFVRVCLCISLLRVIDNLESFSFPEWQIRGGSWLVVIQSHKRGHAAYGKVQETNIDCYFDAFN